MAELDLNPGLVFMTQSPCFHINPQTHEPHTVWSPPSPHALLCSPSSPPYSSLPFFTSLPCKHHRPHPTGSAHATTLTPQGLHTPPPSPHRACTPAALSTRMTVPSSSLLGRLLLPQHSVPSSRKAARALSGLGPLIGAHRPHDSPVGLIAGFPAF